MADHGPAGEPDRPDAGGHPPGVWPGWMHRRREKIIAEIERNRRGEYTVPTWLLVVFLVVIVGGWAALVILS
jgi:hypothetical protein